MKVKKQTVITLVEHQSAKKLVLSFFRIEHPRLTDSKLLETKTDFDVFLDRKIKNAKVKDILQAVKACKMWGYCKHLMDGKKEIHYWLAKPPLDVHKVFEIFAHEVAHALGYSREKTAQKIGAAAAFTYELFKKDIEKKCR